MHSSATWALYTFRQIPSLQRGLGMRKQSCMACDHGYAHLIVFMHACGYYSRAATNRGAPSTPTVCTYVHALGTTSDPPRAIGGNVCFGIGSFLQNVCSST